jgi:hypothetical protein
MGGGDVENEDDDGPDTEEESLKGLQESRTSGERGAARQRLFARQKQGPSQFAAASKVNDLEQGTKHRTGQAEQEQQLGVQVPGGRGAKGQGGCRPYLGQAGGY